MFIIVSKSKDIIDKVWTINRKYSGAGSSLQLEPKCLGAIKMVAPA